MYVVTRFPIFRELDRFCCSYVRASHLCRPGLWRGPGDLLAVYHLLEVLVASASTEDACSTATSRAQQQPRQKASVEDLAMTSC